MIEMPSENLARRGSPDPVETGDRRSPLRLEIFGRTGGSVRRPATARFALLWLLIGFSFVSASDVNAEVSAGLEAQLQAALQEDPFQVDDE